MSRSPANLALATVVLLAVSCGDGSAPWVSSSGRGPGESGLLNPAPRTPKSLVAHGGGGLPLDQGEGAYLDYSNSIEALDLSYEKGHRLFELDFEWTTDGRLVAVHDWDELFERLFREDAGRRSHAEFMSLQSPFGFRQLDLLGVVDWLDAHPDARIVTDIKSRNVEGLREIRRAAPLNLNRFIPQIYQAHEWQYARGLGFRDIIFTLYETDISDADLVAFVARHDLFAVTMPEQRARTSLPCSLRDRGVFVYAHTVNSLEVFGNLHTNRCVDGIYTDVIFPDFESSVRESSAESGGATPRETPATSLKRSR